MRGELRRKIRILIVDDSYFIRNLLRKILEGVEDFEIVGEAKDGAEAVDEALRLRPGVITMDFNMPKLTGAEAVGKILAGRDKKPPAILMLSAYTKEGAQETLESLRSGAVDFITKPSGEHSVDLDKIAQEIITKIRMAAQAQIRRYPPKKLGTLQKGFRGGPLHKVVALGASTGGPPVVEDILSALPPDFGGAVLVAQHMPAYFTARFAERLSALSPLGIKEAAAGDAIGAGTVYIIPGDHPVLALRKVASQQQGKWTMQLFKDSHFQGASPSIDRMMQAVAAAFGAKAIGVILSGMGDDGARGMWEIKAAGGLTIVQDPVTAVVSAMPEAVIGSKAADLILPPREIAQKLITLCY